jgi:hypothetical protein
MLVLLQLPPVVLRVLSGVHDLTMTPGTSHGTANLHVESAAAADVYGNSWQE